MLFWRYRQQAEVDFIWRRSEGLLPIEVKYQNTLRDSDLKSFLLLSRRIGTTRAWVVCKYPMPTRTINGVHITYLPAHELDDAPLT